MPKSRILMIPMTTPKVLHLTRFMGMTTVTQLRPITPMRETIMCLRRLRTAFPARISVSNWCSIEDLPHGEHLEELFQVCVRAQREQEGGKKLLQSKEERHGWRRSRSCKGKRCGGGKRRIVTLFLLVQRTRAEDRSGTRSRDAYRHHMTKEQLARPMPLLALRHLSFGRRVLSHLHICRAFSTASQSKKCRPYTFHLGASWAAKPKDPYEKLVKIPFPSDSSIGSWRIKTLAWPKLIRSPDPGEDFLYIQPVRPFT